MKKLTKRKGFNFLRSYFDVLNELKEDSDKLKFLMAIINKQFLDENPEGLGFIANLCYESQRHHIEQSVKGYKTKTNCDLLGNPLRGATGGATEGALLQEKEKEKEKEKVQEQLMSEIKISDVPISDVEFYEIAKAFHQLFEQNIISSGGTLKNIRAAKFGKWVSPIRLMLTKDGIKKEDLQLVFKFLQHDEFWKPNVQSTAKLRTKFNTIIGQAKRNGNTKKKSGVSPDFIANLYN